MRDGATRERLKKIIKDIYLENPIQINEDNTSTDFKEYVLNIRHKTGLGIMDSWLLLKEVISEIETSKEEWL